MIKRLSIHEQKPMSFKKAIKWMTKDECNMARCNGTNYFIGGWYDDEDKCHEELEYAHSMERARVDYELVYGKWYKVEEWVEGK